MRNEDKRNAGQQPSGRSQTSIAVAQRALSQAHFMLRVRAALLTLQDETSILYWPRRSRAIDGYVRLSSW
jgi:hypothetical protein